LKALKLPHPVHAGPFLRKGSLHERGDAPILPLKFDEVRGRGFEFADRFNEILPDGGLPRGAVVEVASPYGLARASSIALAACAAAQADARLRGGERSAGAWCAWIEPAAATSSARPASQTSLLASAVERVGVDLEHLLIICPSPGELARVAARVAASRVFSAIVIDLVGVPGHRVEAQLERWVNPIRRIAMAIEGTETVAILLTDALAPRALPLPVAMRLEVERPSATQLRLAVAKERRGRVAKATPVTLPATPEGIVA
jgi:recombination protein RecA